jgi:DNA-binding response OmpR family regulator
MSALPSDFVSSPTVLVVDDNAEMVEFLKLYLSHHGMQVLSAYSGKQCLELVTQHKVDIVVLDVMMPEMSGIETCQALKAMPATRAIPVLLLTAKDDKDIRIAGIKSGICEFLTKPIRGRELLERISLQLTVRQWEQKLDRLSELPPADELQV